MEFLFDNDRDPLWFFLLILCMVSFVGLVYRRFRPPNDDWNAKTKDYWFSLLLFAATGVAVAYEGLHDNDDFEPSLALATVACLVCLNGLRRAGRWRGDGYANDKDAGDESVSPR